MGRRAEERGCVVFLGNGPCFSTFRTATGPISFLRLSGHFDEIFPTRVSSDNPRLKAFCRVAPSVLFNLRAISAARFLLRASLFNVRICSAVHTRLFIWSPQSKRLLPPLIAMIKSATDPDSDLNHNYRIFSPSKISLALRPSKEPAPEHCD